MKNKNEQEEKKYLSNVLGKLENSHKKIVNQISGYSDEIQHDSDYLWQNKSDMDGVEKAGNRLAVQQMKSTREESIAAKSQIESLILSPYFGRIDFEANDESEEDTYYIGMHTYSEKAGDKILIYDWRAPISSMFYDFECGEAQYQAPAGTIAGDIRLKRQYKIRESQMEYMVESAVNINDDVLQKELSSTSNEKMKNIVVTIQREQNAIIRNEKAQTLIVQGVAGSGKTSIALHRVAFLLYRFKGTLKSDNVMIISPNKVFAAYISNVLPELGEENILEIGMEDIAEQLLDEKTTFQGFSEQVASLVKFGSPELVNRIQYKASVEFVEHLQTYLEGACENYFHPVDTLIDGIAISRKEIMECYQTFAKLPISERLDQTSVYVIQRTNRKLDKKITSSTAKKIKTAIARMFLFKDSLALYEQFYNQIDRQDLFVGKKGKPLPYEDLFPFLYTKLYFDDLPKYKQIQHLLVDEMQDYTPIQYAVLLKLFQCKMTILGDSNQSVNPYSSSSLPVIKSIFPDAECVELCRSYRSTYEITMFAQSISRNDKLIPVERHGLAPTVRAYTSKEKQIRDIRKMICEHLDSNYHTMGIICKTDSLASEMYDQIKDLSGSIFKVDFKSNEYQQGIVVTSAHMAKGLEFDQVIIPSVDAENYVTALDRSLLYIACTRAMHRLDLTYCGEITPILKESMCDEVILFSDEAV